MVVLVYGLGWMIDEWQQHNWFVGGLLPMVAYRTIPWIGNTNLKGLWVAWFWKGVCFNPVIEECQDED